MNILAATNSWTKNIFDLQPQLLTLILTTIIILICAFIYKKNISKLKPNEAPNGFTLVVENFTKTIEKTVIDVMGMKFRWFTPYALYLILYLGIGNIITLLGFDSIATNYTIILSLGLITFIGIYVVGIKFQKWGFAMKFVKNPLELITQFAPLISITFRIFGNLTAGATILALFYDLTGNAGIKVPGYGVNTYGSFIKNTDPNNPYDPYLSINLLGGLLAPPFHFYFDMFDGLIQAYIFMILTLSYIGQEAEHETKPKKKSRKMLPLLRSQKQREIIDSSIDVVRRV